jgi:O-antigen/teichoic acid export membrane protein
VINVLIVVILSRSGCDLLWVKLGSSLVFAVKPVIYSIYRKKHYTIVRTLEGAKLKNQWTAIGQHMAYFIQNNIAIFTLTVFADLKAVAVYSVYHLISYSLRNVVTSFGGGMEAMFGDMIARNEMKELNKAYRRYKQVLTLLTLTLFGTAMILIVPFVKLYTAEVTDTNYIHPLFAGILLLGDALYCLTLPCYNLPIAAGKLKESRAGAYGEAVISVMVSVALVFWNPLLGVGIGLLASMLFKGVYLIMFSSKKILHITPWKMMRDFCGTTMVLVLVAYVGIHMTACLPIDNYISWVVHGVGIVAVMCMVAILVVNALYPGNVKRAVSSFLAHRRKRK